MKTPQLSLLRRISGRRWLVLAAVIVTLAVIGRFSGSGTGCPGCCRVYYQ